LTVFINLLAFLGTWELLNFPNPPSSRYGMASANSIGDGLYIFGGFGMQGSSQYYNPYMAYGQSGLPGYKKSAEVTKTESSGVSSKQGYNPGGYNNPSGYNMYTDNDDRADENYYPLQDGWVLSFR
jgi:hypothetical protein